MKEDHNLMDGSNQKRLALSAGPEVPGEDEGRDAVPEGGHEGQEALSDARRRGRNRRALG